MNRLSKILRAIATVAVMFVILVPSGLYVLLSTDWAHGQMRRIAENELSKTLGTEVSIEKLDFAPFNRIKVIRLAAKDDFGKEALTVTDIAARFELIHFIRTGKINIDYVAIDSLHLNLYRESADRPLNIDRIISRLTKKEPNKKPSRFNLAISTIKINDSGLRYEVLDELRKTDRFDKNHISVSDINLSASLPILRNDTIVVELDRLNLKEQSGITINDLTANILYSEKALRVTNLFMSMPDSRFGFNEINLPYPSPKGILQSLHNQGITLSTIPGSYMSGSDLKAFLPELAQIPGRFYTDIDLVGNLDKAAIRNLTIENRQTGLLATVQGQFDGFGNPKEIRFKNASIQLSAQPGSLNIISRLLAKGNDAANIDRILRQAGNISADINGNGSVSDFTGTAEISTAAGNISADIKAARDNNVWRLITSADISELDAGVLLSNPVFGRVTATADFDGTVSSRNITGSGGIDIAQLGYSGHVFENIVMDGTLNADKTFSGEVHLDDSRSGFVNLAFEGSHNSHMPRLAVKGDIRDLALRNLGMKGKYAGCSLSADVDADLTGTRGVWVNGYARIDRLRMADSIRTLNINHFEVKANNTQTPNYFSVESDILNGRAEGIINLSSLVPQLRELFATAMPAFGSGHTGSEKYSAQASEHTTGHHHTPGVSHGHSEKDENNFNFEFKIANAENLSTFLELPVGIIYPVSIDGIIDNIGGIANLTIDAPYLQQKDNIIENTSLHADINRNDGRAELYATTTMPTQKGVLALATSMSAAANRVDTRIDWQIERDKPINGNFSFSTLVGRGSDGGYNADIAINPGDITFGESVWKVAPARIFAARDLVTADGFSLTSGDQSIGINGTASAADDSRLTVSLTNLELINIFRTLDINNALIGGKATGDIHAAHLFARTPAIDCERLFVKDISYNDCVLGDGEVAAAFDPERTSFDLDAVISEASGRKSYIKGTIFAKESALDISFDADRVPVGFMKPFMSAFAADLTGYASGHARLFGTFHDIDLEGDVLADSLGLKLDFTNTWYYATDSVHIRPGVIHLNDITMRDAYGHTALLNGYVRHKCFHLPDFQFRLTDADHLLCYDVPSSKSPDWYGRVFGNGSAFISGKPGVVNIDVNMSTTEGSTFTFVLSDNEEADEYNFITFRDKTPKPAADSITDADPLPAAVREYQERMLAKAANADRPSDYNMNIQVDITPAARIILVMDPVGGDEIKSNGTGNLRMTYNSNGNELHMYGNYIIDKGSYNFTLQDIIVKDFTINEGSSISFTGDPYAARLDIKASYNVNANLSDLDESFLQDKDLNRTNVPVSAVLMAKGDMRQPDISFDLAFPTLNSDIYRKVRSIISTDDMMNRQIIYLLALNRFYTPEYMSTTKGNELFSVASSTISSQLSSMLGKLSENWSIAPNLRSDRGDFSDVEIDVALSSSLLNNRLLFNGNFGYRDKSLNNNQFIGDFDIEYLLNRRGTWRLKAYNRYNDQNYYLRTAQTTQGVGIMFKRDFDNMFNFLKPKKKKLSEIKTTVPKDTTNVVIRSAATKPEQPDAAQRP